MHLLTIIPGIIEAEITYTCEIFAFYDLKYFYIARLRLVFLVFLSLKVKPSLQTTCNTYCTKFISLHIQKEKSGMAVMQKFCMQIIVCVNDFTVLFRTD